MQLIKYELYKIFSQKVVYIALSVFILFYCLHFFGALNVALEKKKKLFYEQFGGNITEEKIAWARQVLEAPPRKQPMNEDLIAQNSVATDIVNAVNLKEQYEQFLKESAKKVERLKGRENVSALQKAELKEIEVWKKVEYPKSVYYLNGWKNIIQYMNEVGYFFVGALTILGLSNVFSHEYSTRMDSLIFSSRYGRRKIVLAKIAAAAVFCTVINALLACVVFSLNGYCYGLSGWNQPLVTLLDLFSSTGFDGPIWAFYLKQQLYATLGCIILGIFVLLLSSRTKLSIVPAFIGGVVLIFPVVIEMANIPLVMPVKLLLDILRFTDFIKLNHLDNYHFLNFFGFPLQYGWYLLIIMLTYGFISLLLLMFSIKKRQVI